MAPYPYPTPNSELIKRLNMVPHPEGGYFVETMRNADWKVSSEYAEKKPRDLYTTIYYLLTPKPGNTGGYMHTNKSESVHVHNQGRAYFTLIDPSARPLQIRKLVMGSNEANGEVRQVLVKSGVWKIIELPEEDVKSADKDGENVGCLMSEIVVPGFEFEDHIPMTKEGLVELFKGESDGQKYVDLWTPILKK